MAYQTYTTRAVVIESYNRVGADRSVRLFTEDAGMLYARASGVRFEKSKMRYALQPFSICRVTLLRGKSEWRIIGAESICNLFFEATERGNRAQLLRFMRFLSRLIHGEEAHPLLFRTCVDGLMHIATTTPDQRTEDILTFRLLHTLGYVAAHPMVADVLHTATLREACMIPLVAESGAHMQRHIALALTVSQL